jgi:hypothetical protein
VREALRRQEAALDNLRSRAGGLIGAAGVATAFLGNAGLRAGWTAPAVLAAISFCAVLALNLAVLWPRSGWVFFPRVQVLAEHYVGRDVPKDRALETLSRFAQGWYDRNEGKLKSIVWLYQAGLVALGLEIYFWLFAI